MKQVHLKISGRVQGVFFRAETEVKARQLGITGWVRNTEDGGVEVFAQGQEAQLDEFIAWCKKGPERAQVENVEISEGTSDSSIKDFSIIL